ncbi:hypothetical protein N9903_01815 [bacterium]|nr:hypothetical protein [bacterium]
MGYVLFAVYIVVVVFVGITSLAGKRISQKNKGEKDDDINYMNYLAMLLFAIAFLLFFAEQPTAIIPFVASVVAFIAGKIWG